MYSLQTLLITDITAIRRWFAKNRLSKSTIAFLFTLVVAGVMYIIFLVSRGLFINLSGFEEFGVLTTYYLIHAAVLSVSWFAVLAAATYTIMAILMPPANLHSLLTLPLPAQVLGTWQFIKSALGSALILCIVILPVTIAYDSTVVNVSAMVMVLRVLTVLALLTGLTTGTGVIVAMLAALLFKRFSPILLISGIVGFGFGAYGLVKLIFPSSLIKLYTIPADQFFPAFWQLPLNTFPLPTRALSLVLTQGISLPTITVFMFTLAVILIAISAHSYLFNRLLTPTGSGSGPKKPTQFGTLPLVVKDWVLLMRSNTELSYGLFLLMMAVFFFMLLSQARIIRLVEAGFTNELIVFTFLWLLFFTTAFALRMIFPLMAKIGPLAWHLVTQPILKSEIFINQIHLSLILIVPFIGLNLVVWSHLPFAVSPVAGAFLRLYGSWAILFLTLGIYGLGAIAPNFRAGNEPEKVSSGPWGLAALTYALAYTIGTAFALWLTLKGTPATTVTIVFFIVSFGSTAVILLLARSALKHYQFL